MCDCGVRRYREWYRAEEADKAVATEEWAGPLPRGLLALLTCRGLTLPPHTRPEGASPTRENYGTPGGMMAATQVSNPLAVWCRYLLDT
jgi:hypothetical protein